MIDNKLLAILVCPKCKSAVTVEGETVVCMSRECGLRYSIRDDIPFMIVEEAKEPTVR